VTGLERHPPFGLVGAEFERTLVGGAGLVGAAKPAKELGACRVQVEITVDPVDGNVA
jgi:hypothetical protein